MALSPLQQPIHPDSRDLWSVFTAIAPYDELCTVSFDGFSTSIAPASSESSLTFSGGPNKRSITSWRSQSKPTLTTVNLGRSDFAMSDASNSTFVEMGINEFDALRTSSSKPGYGIGRQGEKAAGLKVGLTLMTPLASTAPASLGFLMLKPVESLPRYAPRPASTPSISSHPFSPTPRLQSTAAAL